MRKRIIVYRDKADGKEEFFPTCTELVKVHGKNDTGVTIGSLWNGLNKGCGHFENARCEIFYKPVQDLEILTWN